MVRVVSVELAAQLQAPLLQQEEVNQTQDMGCSSGHDDGWYRPLYGFGELLSSLQSSFIVGRCSLQTDVTPMCDE